MNIDLKKYLGHVGRLRRHSVPRRFELLNPGREWLVGLVLAGALFLGLGGHAGIFFYTSIKQAEEGFGSKDAVAQVYNHKRVENALKTYRAREASFETLRKGSSPVIISGDDLLSTTTLVVESEASTTVAGEGGEQVE